MVSSNTKHRYQHSQVLVTSCTIKGHRTEPLAIGAVNALSWVSLLLEFSKGFWFIHIKAVHHWYRYLFGLWCSNELKSTDVSSIREQFPANKSMWEDLVAPAHRFRDLPMVGRENPCEWEYKVNYSLKTVLITLVNWNWESVVFCAYKGLILDQWYRSS